MKTLRNIALGSLVLGAALSIGTRAAYAENLMGLLPEIRQEASQNYKKIDKLKQEIDALQQRHNYLWSAYKLLLQADGNDDGRIDDKEKAALANALGLPVDVGGKALKAKLFSLTANEEKTAENKLKWVDLWPTKKDIRDWRLFFYD